MATTCTSHWVAHWRPERTTTGSTRVRKLPGERGGQRNRGGLQGHLAIADRGYEVFPRGCGEVQHGAMSMLLGVADPDHLAPWRGSCLHAVDAGIAATGLAPTRTLDAITAAVA